MDGIWEAALRGIDAAWEVRLDGEVLTARTPERMFSGASMIKTLIAAVVPPERLADRVLVTDAAPSDGIVRFRLPVEHTLADLVVFMIAVSDNTATNAVVRHLGGVDAVNERIAARGWSSRLHRMVGEPGHPDLSAVSIADHQAALNSTDPAPFLAQQDRRSLARWVTDGAPFAHKTGTAGGVRHDAGLLGRLSVACFTNNADQAEYVDHPACVAMGDAMRRTLAGVGYANFRVTPDRLGSDADHRLQS